MTRYAEKTSVSSYKSREEIERNLMRYGANGFMYGTQQDQAMVAFQMHGKHVKFVLPMPDPRHRAFTHTPGRVQLRSKEQQEKAYEQAVMQRWRALALVIKAKLEAIEAGISEFESEFMAHIVLPSGETVGDWMRPQIEHAYEHGKMPPLLPHTNSNQ
jgi:hypothetical protein